MGFTEIACAAQGNLNRSEPSATSRKILLVSEDPREIELFLTGFGRAELLDYLAIVKGEQEAARTILANPPDVAVLDYHMIEQRGFAVLTLVRSSFPMVPIVVLADSAATADIARLYELGVVSVYQKPPKRDDYLNLIAALAQLAYLRIPPP
jgi:CheY-like chemotaxis protein